MSDSLTFTGSAQVTTNLSANKSNIDIIAGPTGYAELASNNYESLVRVNDTAAYILTGEGQLYTWTFDASGNLTTEGNIIVPVSSSIYTQNESNITPIAGVSSHSNPTTQLVTAGDFNGETIKGTAGEQIETGNVIYLNSNGKWYLADATPNTGNYTGTNLLGILISTTTVSADDIITVLLQGHVYTTVAGSSTSGVPIWLDTTAGRCTATAPSSTGNVKRQVGHVLSANKIRFNPDNYYSIV
jgi:hypothetical protein